MLILISPAKNLNLDRQLEDLEMTRPRFSKENRQLATIAKKLKVKEIERLMGISTELAKLTKARFKVVKLRNTDEKSEDLRPAALMFSGEVYIGLDAQSMDKDQLLWAQDHLRILSGFYGILCPLDEIMPYRLEMGTKLANEYGDDLYDFWDTSIAKAVNRASKKHTDRSVINLASAEYFKAVDRGKLKREVITPIFKDVKDGKARTLFVYAKRARGVMARWIIDNRIEKAEKLTDFDGMGYRFDPELSKKDSGKSKDTVLTFTRQQPPPMR